MIPRTPAPTPVVPGVSVPPSIINPQSGGGGVPVPVSQFIPANGFAGFAQQTPAVQALYGGGRRSGGGRRRKKKAAAVVKRGARRVAKRAAGGVLKKGSAAMKAKMAKLRKMRKKK